MRTGMQGLGVYPFSKFTSLYLLPPRTFQPSTTPQHRHVTKSSLSSAHEKEKRCIVESQQRTVPESRVLNLDGAPGAVA
jgi:hypothetical protein